MLHYTEKYVSARIREAETSFKEKLLLVGVVLPQMELIESVKVIRLLLECALHTRPSYDELDALCEVSETSELLHDYLRGFFIDDTRDPVRLEMAQRLEGVISLRISGRKAKSASTHKLRQTVAEYLLRARN